MTYHSLWAFWLILPLIAIVVWTLWRKKNNTPTLQFGSIELLKTVTPSLRTRLMNVPTLLKALALVMAIMALARPQTMNTKVKKMWKESTS